MYLDLLAQQCRRGGRDHGVLLDGRWSSAAARIGEWGIEDWREVLERGVEDAALLRRIREATNTGRPHVASCAVPNRRAPARVPG